MKTPPSDTTATMAVFLDLENIALGAREAQFPEFDIRKILERLLLKGHIVVKKAYCDFGRYKDFKRGLHEAALRLKILEARVEQIQIQRQTPIEVLRLHAHFVAGGGFRRHRLRITEHTVVDVETRPFEPGGHRCVELW